MFTKNLIVAGDSFCSHDGWPGSLANNLDLNLINYGAPGQHWWSVRDFLNGLSSAVLDNCEVIVLAHTCANRIPHLNAELSKIDMLNTTPVTDIEKSVYYYYKYIYNEEFMSWAQEAWFKEVSEKFAHKKIVHLHSFPWTIPLSNLLTGMTVAPSLMSISLNELGLKSLSLFNDTRLNHLNTKNNQELAQQLTGLINDYTPGSVRLDLTKFEQINNHWKD